MRPPYVCERVVKRELVTTKTKTKKTVLLTQHDKTLSLRPREPVLAARFIGAVLLCTKLTFQLCPAITIIMTRMKCIGVSDLAVLVFLLHNFYHKSLWLQLDTYSVVYVLFLSHVHIVWTVKQLLCSLLKVSLKGPLRRLKIERFLWSQQSLNRAQIL